MPSDQFSTQGLDNAEARLQQISADLDHLRQNLTSQLQGEVQQLQQHKSELQQEIQTLEAQRRSLMQQMAPTLVSELKSILKKQGAASNQINGSTQDITAYGNNANRLIADLDSTFRTTFKTLQLDLNSYHSSLSQQLSQMYTLEQQGEAILDALVNRLKEELHERQQPTIAPPSIIQQTMPASTTTDYGYQQNQIIQDNHGPLNGGASLPEKEVYTPTLGENAKKKEITFSKSQLGLMLILFSSLILSLQNVVISIILNQSSIFGLIKTGGYISPGIGNSLLILFLRMVFVVPAMCLIARSLHPSSFKDIEKFIQTKDWMLFLKAAGSGFALFLSQVLIYTALGPLSPGVAITIFFIFPIVTLLLAWFVFGERPTNVRWLVAFLVVFGVALISAPSGSSQLNFPLGSVLAAIFSGVSFAAYILLTQACSKKIHPVPFSVINFGTIFVFSAISLLLTFTPLLPDSWAVDVAPGKGFSVLLSGIILGVLTLLSYLSNNIGISYIGAAISSIFGATGPVLTSLLSLIVIGKTLTGQQVGGMLVVTIGVLALNLERMFGAKAKAKQKSSA
ncbi:MAG: EamA family transporter [Limnothrix sp. RL_2_0]|nr:EamA family transporter [Limnothrix sp. RL_2_0]